MAGHGDSAAGAVAAAVGCCHGVRRRVRPPADSGTGRPGTGPAGPPSAPGTPLSRGCRAAGCANPGAPRRLWSVRPAGPESQQPRDGSRAVLAHARGKASAWGCRRDGEPGPAALSAASSGTVPPFSRPPPVSAARPGRCTRRSPGRSVWSVPGAPGAPRVAVDSRAQPPARHGPGSADSLPGARGCCAPRPPAARERRMDPPAPRGPRCKEHAGNGAGTAAAEHCPGRGSLPELGPPPLTAERAVSAGERCAGSAPRTAPAPPPRPGPRPAGPGVSPGSGSCAPTRVASASGDVGPRVPGFPGPSSPLAPFPRGELDGPLPPLPPVVFSFLPCHPGLSHRLLPSRC